MKKEFIKRAGQIYALGIQKGKTDAEMLELLSNSFELLTIKKKGVKINEGSRFK
jgi:histidyl-tRNA synthetase